LRWRRRSPQKHNPTIDAQVAESTTAGAIAPAKIAEPPKEVHRQSGGGDDIEQLIDLIAAAVDAGSTCRFTRRRAGSSAAPKVVQAAVPKIDLWERIRRGFQAAGPHDQVAVQSTRGIQAARLHRAHEQPRQSLSVPHRRRKSKSAACR